MTAIAGGGRPNRVSRIHGVGRKTCERMESAGIRTLEDVVSAGEGGLAELVNAGPAAARRMVAKAGALLSGEAIPLARLRIPRDPLMFVDIETDLGQSYVWLISVCGEGGESFRQFYAESPAEEKGILSGFLEHRKKFGGHVLCYYSGAGFDERVIKSRMARLGLEAAETGGWFDLCTAVKRSVALPTESFSLKPVGAYCGYRYRVRWGIWTGYRDAEGMRPMTASRSLSVRLAYSPAMYNARMLPGCQARPGGLACAAPSALISRMIYGSRPPCRAAGASPRGTGWGGAHFRLLI